MMMTFVNRTRTVVDLMRITIIAKRNISIDLLGPESSYLTISRINQKAIKKENGSMTKSIGNR